MVRRIIQGLILLACLGCAPKLAQAADVSYLPPTPKQKVAFVHLDGVIVAGDARRLELGLMQAQQSGQPIGVMLISRGGDVDESMIMGRLIRKYQANTYHMQCASSCVFAFLGGVQRFTAASGPDALVIHRPELAESYVASPSLFAKKMLDVLRDYIALHTGSANLYEAMMLIPFSKPYALSPRMALSLGAATMVLP
jgi:hypothetical protein